MVNLNNYLYKKEAIKVKISKDNFIFINNNSLKRGIKER